MSSTGRSEGRRNARLALICVAVFLGMVGAAYASVPLYRAFCQATGFDGTVRRAEAAPTRVLDRTVRVRFDTNVRDLPVRFRPEEGSQTLRIGQTGLAFFEVTNTSNRPLQTQAIFNVVPESAGAYFHKLQCFCFTEQRLNPGETARYPMVYFVDPEFATDPETRGASEITLSYTIYPARPG